MTPDLAFPGPSISSSTSEPNKKLSNFMNFCFVLSGPLYYILSTHVNWICCCIQKISAFRVKRWQTPNHVQQPVTSFLGWLHQTVMRTKKCGWVFFCFCEKIRPTSCRLKFLWMKQKYSSILSSDEHRSWKNEKQWQSSHIPFRAFI